jgi:hypothetical protein
MKKIICLIFGISLILAPGLCYAHHHRVSNVAGAAAEFSTVQSAHDAINVLTGDTLYVEPSASSYGNLFWTKRLVIIGNGYYLASNPETQANISTSMIAYVQFRNGSDESIITGCELGQVSVGVPGSSTDAVNNLFLQRNLINCIRFSGTAGGNNIHFIQNNIYGGDYLSELIGGGGPFANVFFENNLIYHTAPGWGGSFYFPNADVKMELINNVIRGNMTGINSSLLRNNIFFQGSASFTNCGLYNNIGDAAQFGTTNGNQSNVNMADVFICWSNCNDYSPDGKYQLKPGSVAAGGGYGGADCGAFGGNYPYVLSGIPNIPAIYYLNIEPSGTQLNVNVKIKSHD